MFPDSASVKKYEIGVVGLILKDKSRSLKHTLDSFAVRDILLTSVSAYKRNRLFAALAVLHYLIYQINILILSIIEVIDSAEFFHLEKIPQS